MHRLLIVIAFLTLSSMAFAGTIVTMQYNGAGGNSYGGFYTYPYNVSVNNTPEISDAHQLQRARHSGRNVASN